MALLEALTTNRPTLQTLLKWASAAFLLPLLVFAIVPAVITALAQLPGPGRMTFAFFGGVLLSVPIILLRAHLLSRKRQLQINILGMLAVLAVGSLILFYFAFIPLLKVDIDTGLYSIFSAVLVGSALFIGAFEAVFYIDKAYSRWQKRRKGCSAKALRRQ
jgi:hypothetical protein